MGHGHPSEVVRRSSVLRRTTRTERGSTLDAMVKQGWLGVAVIVVGGVLALFFRDMEFLWFRGGPLGVVLVLVGILELAESARRGRRTGVGSSG